MKKFFWYFGIVHIDGPDFVFVSFVLFLSNLESCERHIFVKF